MSLTGKGMQGRHAFRRLVRAQKKAFGPDVDMSRVAMQEIRKKFYEHAHVTDEQKMQELMQHVDDAESFMRNNIAQGHLSPETGRYRTLS
ncbi:Mitochondrial zinc maintenance protein 1, mitochondrial [Porphyridium purpureum]|uniref:Mitochondrial zinc maintenance protein 1, mitochondrial n=1 Tax=Porphyridium purpureum TaxID=35688 RepID=A0A5J4YUK7_PORPP|nr:Mitochondrial zinc maintenance protein 1, mitochondrial [Porphyridium purpureum]|eukprot:POR8067..scf227_4